MNPKTNLVHNCECFWVLGNGRDVSTGSRCKLTALFFRRKPSSEKKRWGKFQEYLSYDFAEQKLVGLRDREIERDRDSPAEREREREREREA